jgi:Zn-dependent protease with chaperone function
MKRATLILFLIALPATAQLRISSKQVAEACGGAFIGAVDSYDVPVQVKGAIEEDPNRPGMAAFRRSTERLMPIFQSGYPRDRLIIALISSNVINAWAVAHWITSQGDPNHPSPVSLICVATGFIDFMTDEDELAFVVGHEIGHTIDAASSCGSAAIYATLPRESKVICEMRADEEGYKLIRQAGYSGYAAAGAFGRIEMYYGDTATGMVGWLRQMALNHPITPKRIENMRRLLMAESSK